MLKDSLMDQKGTKGRFKVFLDLPPGRVESFQTEIHDDMTAQIWGEGQEVSFGHLSLR